MNLKTRIRSAGMRYFVSAGYQERRRSKARNQREESGRPATVHYFGKSSNLFSMRLVSCQWIQALPTGSRE